MSPIWSGFTAVMRRCLAWSYIGDGASVSRSLVRRRGKTLIGHASVREQLKWCREEVVRNIIITHCGSQIVKGDSKTLDAKVKQLASEFGVQLAIATDEMEINLSNAQ